MCVPKDGDEWNRIEAVWRLSMTALLDEQISSANAANHNETKTVLIIDESEETRDVLATALERRGVRAFTASVPRRGAAIAREQKPDLVIFDVDSASSTPEQAIQKLTHDGNVENASILAIGSMKFEAPVGEGEFISKPYHFAPLLKRIEEFLQGAGNVEISDEHEIEIIR